MQVLFFCTFVFVKKKKIAFRSACPISTALDIFGDKWSLLIIRDLMFTDKNTYGDFLSSEEKIATNILADRLALLECSGIISKHKHPGHKLKGVYKLTQKGIDLVPVLIEIIFWSQQHEQVHPYAAGFAKMVKKDREGFIKQLTESLKKR
ncbi:MAG: helix-turn-helix transcriptional regulator [Ferruginibacter sp.]|nr:helix-turn-helix transcriptional regulator [Ferruginibacter sp.]